jgi:uncharacterized protein YndB with AHSA1/START domain
MTIVRLDRVLAASPARVWRALTAPQELTAWFWPARLHPAAMTEVRPDGRYVLTADAMAVRGSYTDPDRLGFSWQWDGEEASSAVTIELSAVDGGTALALTHEGLADADAVESHTIGWSDCLDRLPAHLAAESAT